MDELFLVVNPRAGRGAGARLAPHIVAELEGRGIRTQVVFSRAARDGIDLVHDALRKGVPRVAVAGGDGTIFEGVNGWMRAGAPRDAALGIVPIGTGNDFVKMLGLGGDWRAACRSLSAGRARRVDLGRCGEWWFANGVGAGFDAQVALAANRIRWLRGTPVYAAALFDTLLRDYRTPRVRIAYDAGEIEDTVTLVAAANGRCYGGAFKVAPTASIEDGLLDLVVARGLSRGEVLRFCPSVLRGTHLGRDGVRHHRTRTVRLEAEESMVVHADGEIIDQHARRLDIEIHPGALNVLA
jgi:YegS/Rv2252/BmrU family lipid kinase